MLKSFVTILTLIFLSCNNSNNAKNDTTTSSIQPEESDVFPVQELIVDNGEEQGWGGDVRLSITRMENTAASIIYTAKSRYKDQNVGLTVEVSKMNRSVLTIKGTGDNSNNLLNTLSKLYNLGPDSNRNFVDEIRVSYIDLREYAKDQFGNVDTSGWIAPIEYKLFFKGKTDEYAELYLNLNETEHWLELREKDPEYRPLIINFLTKK